MKKSVLPLLALIFIFLYPEKASADGLVNVVIPERELVVSNTPLDLYLPGDIIESAISVGTFVSSFAYKKFFVKSDWDGQKLDLDTVPAFDRWSAHPYNHSLDLAGDVTSLFNLVLVPLSFFGSELLIGNIAFSDVMVLTKLYGDAFLFSYGVKNWLNVAVNRYRPYMYFDDPYYDEIKDGEYKWSFPSGHVKAAFMTATFMHYTLCQYFPDSVWKWPVIAVSYAAATLTGVLRVLSGNHFFTDVLSGAAIGVASTLAILVLHDSNITKNTKGVLHGSVSPLSLSYSFSL